MPNKKEGRKCANTCGPKSVIAQPRDYLTTIEKTVCAVCVLMFLVEALGWAVRCVL